jgi:hypothetical protein
VNVAPVTGDAGPRSRSARLSSPLTQEANGVRFCSAAKLQVLTSVKLAHSYALVEIQCIARKPSLFAQLRRWVAFPVDAGALLR